MANVREKNSHERDKLDTIETIGDDWQRTTASNTQKAGMPTCLAGDDHQAACMRIY
jgi:hypothetical protein